MADPSQRLVDVADNHVGRQEVVKGSVRVPADDHALAGPARDTGGAGWPDPVGEQGGCAAGNEDATGRPWHSGLPSLISLARHHALARGGRQRACRAPFLGRERHLPKSPSAAKRFRRLRRLRWERRVFSCLVQGRSNGLLPIALCQYCRSCDTKRYDREG